MKVSHQEVDPFFFSYPSKKIIMHGHIGHANICRGVLWWVNHWTNVQRMELILVYILIIDIAVHVVQTIISGRSLRAPHELSFRVEIQKTYASCVSPLIWTLEFIYACGSHNFG